MTAININFYRRKINKIQFVLYQLSHFIGIIFLLTYDFTNNSTAKMLIIVVIIIGTYQYMEFYLLLVFLAIILPYYFFRNCWNNLCQKYRSYKL